MIEDKIGQNNPYNIMGNITFTNKLLWVVFGIFVVFVIVFIVVFDVTIFKQ